MRNSPARFFRRGRAQTHNRKRLSSALQLRPANVAERLERLRWMDGASVALSRRIRRQLPPGPVMDALHGVPLGQPAHPVLSAVPVGFWTSAALLDLLPETEQATNALITAGIAAMGPATLTGLADWSVLHRDQQRVGLVHAAASTAAAAFFCASLMARSAGRQRSGKALSFAGLAIIGAGGYLGGHLSSRLGAGANHAEPVAHLAPLGWHDLCPLYELPDSRPVRRELGYISVLVLREGSSVTAVADRCAHLGGPLHQGKLVTVGGERCISCPWHGSVYRISDGAVVRGPATARQPTFDARVASGGMVQVCPRV